MGDLKTRDTRVRGQIDAVKDYLEAHGLWRVHEHPTQPAAFERDLHTILASSELGTCILRLHYQWLEEHDPGAVRAWLEDRQLAESMKADASCSEIIVTATGERHFPRV